MSEIPVAPVVRILKAAGAERISDDAKKAFADAVEASAEVLAKKAIKKLLPKKTSNSFANRCFVF